MRSFVIAVLQLHYTVHRGYLSLCAKKQSNFVIPSGILQCDLRRSSSRKLPEVSKGHRSISTVSYTTYVSSHEMSTSHTSSQNKIQMPILPGTLTYSSTHLRVKSHRFLPWLVGRTIRLPPPLRTIQEWHVLVEVLQ
jgi:hypothetical protein